MMIAEHAALYRQSPTAVNTLGRLPQADRLRTAMSLLLSCLMVTLLACKPESSSQTNATSAPEAPKSNVPLRVWFVAEPGDKAVIERQWQATYDRPINITVFKATELMQQDKVNCDVIVYPAGMLADFVTRQWLVELPSALQSRPTSPSESEPVDPLPAGWLDQARFDRKLWGISLSVITPVLAANFELPQPAPASNNKDVTPEQSLAYWQSVIDTLKSQPNKSPASPGASNETVVDARAVSDRFMTIFNSITSTENRVGILFDPETLAPRIDQPSAIQTVKLLHELMAAGATSEAVLGSHAAAWNALSSPQANMTICVPPPASPEVDKISSLSVQPPPTNPARAGMRVSAGTNVGRGLIVSITRQCQQTGASVEFVRWLTTDANRQGFAKRIEGILAESTYAPGSSAWKAQRLVQRLGQQPRLPSEPRLAENGKFREILGQEVAAALQGRKNAEEAIAAVANGWQQIINATDKTALTQSYLKSLGL